MTPYPLAVMSSDPLDDLLRPVPVGEQPLNFDASLSVGHDLRLVASRWGK
jgi:hypothetical protein